MEKDEQDWTFQSQLAFSWVNPDYTKAMIVVKVTFLLNN
jgi:hypothetical protein